MNITQHGGPRTYTSTGESSLMAAPPPFTKGPDYAKAWKALMGMATPEMQAMMKRAMAQAEGGK